MNTHQITAIIGLTQIALNSLVSIGLYLISYARFAVLKSN
jgi:hypothetical protein